MPRVISEHAGPAEIHLEPGTRDSKVGGMEEAKVPLEHLQEELIIMPITAARNGFCG